VDINIAPLLKQPLGTRLDLEVAESPIDPLGDNAGLLEASIVDIDAKLHATHTNPGPFFEGAADAHIAATCARCLKPIDAPVHADFAEQYYATIPVDTGIAVMAAPADAKTIGSDFTVDVTDLLREELILATPLARDRRRDGRPLRVGARRDRPRAARQDPLPSGMRRSLPGLRRGSQ